jgi:fructokinase
MEPFSQHAVVCFGEVLWDLLPDKSLPGGAPMNVAYHLNKLGVPATLLTKIGHDDYGEKLLEILSQSGLDTEFVQVDQQHPTGLVYARPNENNEVTYDIAFPAAWDFIEWENRFTEVVQKAAVFVYGSLSSRSAVSRSTLNRLLALAQLKVLDINLRAPHFERATLEHLLQNADILKMNSSELMLLSDWYGTFTTLEDRTQLMMERFQLGTIIVTLGDEGAMVNHKGTVHRHRGFQVQVADTIGSGDSFLAGFIYKTLKGASIDEALTFACGIGAFMATQHGACPAYEIQSVDELIGSKTASPQ